MQPIGSCLWFDTQAEEAANFYVSVFPNSRIVSISRYLAGTGKPVGSVLVVDFILNGSPFMALNAGPQFTFTPAISFVARCADQAEVDTLWAKLLVGGKEVQCGWITDRYGVSWQVAPEEVLAMWESPDRAAAQRAFNAMMTMKKLDLAALKRAFAGG